ncbi:MAG: thermonuclease family protein [Desulfuromonadales bacterium]|nr:thermonuclease family protein [Desulfuromonadales bacterium]
MISRSFSLFLCLSFLLILSAYAEEPVPALQGTVTWIYDGDTLEIDTLGKVRLIGIDVPERESSSRDRYLANRGIAAARQREIYRDAKQFNISQVKGQRVSLILDEPPRDRHGRLLAYVYLPDGRLLNRLLIEQGLAVVYRRFNFSMKDDFLAAETRAKRDGVGMWAGISP